ncbi:MAG: DUF456 domain-containing protein [Bacteroidia bacterium]|nr:DUF456 domain-containing protein [Bacteroidia bacterium]
MSDYILLILGILLMILGIIGCLVPVLPGPPFSFLGLILLHLTRFGHSTNPVLTTQVLIILGAIAVIVTVLDYIVPVWGTKRFGGSKYGTRGATVGLIIGLFLGPLGIILGPLFGAFVGEMIFKDDISYAFKAGFGSLLGFLTGIGLKLAASFVMTFYFVREWIA